MLSTGTELVTSTYQFDATTGSTFTLPWALYWSWPLPQWLLILISVSVKSTQVKPSFGPTLTVASGVVVGVVVSSTVVEAVVVAVVVEAVVVVGIVVVVVVVVVEVVVCVVLIVVAGVVVVVVLAVDCVVVQSVFGQQ